MKNQTKESVVASDLKQIELPKLYIDDVVAAYTAKYCCFPCMIVASDMAYVFRNSLRANILRRQSLIEAAKSRSISLPSLTDFNWRVDVTISTTAMSRVFKPSVMMRMTLSNGQIVTFEASVEKFQELRYNVAKVLKNVYDLKQHPIIFRELE